jgi:hypothetical protein
MPIRMFIDTKTSGMLITNKKLTSDGKLGCSIRAVNRFVFFFDSIALVHMLQIRQKCQSMNKNLQSNFLSPCQISRVHKTDSTNWSNSKDAAKTWHTIIHLMQFVCQSSMPNRGLCE